MKIIDYLLAFALLTAALYGPYSVLLRWLRTPVRVTGKAGQRKHSPAGPSRSADAGAMRQGAATHPFNG